MKKVLLYTTEACHLCELAIEQIEQSDCFDHCLITEIDIATDIDLLRAFATKVPVVSMGGTNNHLFWPFDHYDFSAWLKNN